MSNSKLIDSFKPGDFLFGLENCVREIYYDDLKEKLEKVGAKYHFVTVDDLIKPLEPDYIYDNHLTLSPLSSQCSPIRNYGRLLLSTLAFTKISREITSPLKKQKSKIMIVCLLAIEHHTQKIHFCLDQLDLNKARSKHSQHQHYYDSFTTHELRYIAEHYQEVASKVIFYLRGEQVQAPWEAQGQSAQEWLSAEIEIEKIDNALISHSRLAPLKLDFSSMRKEEGRGYEQTENSSLKRFKFLNSNEIFESNKKRNFH